MSGVTAQESRERVKILVIDDQAIQLGYKQLLGLLGFEVELAQSGYRGVELAERYLPDVILLDYNMPGLNGLQVAQRLRDSQHTLHIPIIMITMSDEPEHIRAAATVGIEDFLSKSINPDDLEAAIHRVVKRRPTPPTKKMQSQPIRSIGELFQKAPLEVMPILANHPKNGWTTLLTEALKSGDNRLRGRAVIALAVWQKEDDAPYNLTDGQHIFWKHIRHSLASSTAPEAEKHWSKLAPIALALIQPPHLVTSALQACMKDSYWECRGWVLRILFENREILTLDLAVEAFADDSGEVRASAAMVLAEQGTSRHIPLLAKAMSDTEPGVREHAATALARIGGDLSTNVLATVLLKSRAGAAEAAANGLVHIATPEAIHTLIEASTVRSEPSVLRRIAHALGKLQTDPCRDALGMLACHEDETVRLAALRYL
ncbi:MAG: response regulator [Chitinophagaceae bacterium]|nr:response regulator [Anaerolineae bacterium]